MYVRSLFSAWLLILFFAAAGSAQIVDNSTDWMHQPSPLNWVEDFDDALAQARKQGKPLFIVFSVREIARPEHPGL